MALRNCKDKDVISIKSDEMAIKPVRAGFDVKL
jgi:hypothetical protein